MDSKIKPLIFLLFAATFIFSFVLKIALHELDPTVSRDGIGYIGLIEGWKEDNTLSVISSPKMISPPPLYLFLVKEISSFDFSVKNSGIALNIILGALIPLVLFGIVKEITHKPILAWCTMLFAVSHPALNELSIQFQRDIAYLFFSALMLWTICKGINKKNNLFFLCSGVFAGMAFLIRYEALELLPIALIFIIVAQINHKIKIKRKGLIYLAFFTLSFVVTVFLLNGLMGTSDYFHKSILEYKKEKITIPNSIQ